MNITFITVNTMASVIGMASATTMPGRTPRLTKLHTRMMPMAWYSEVRKSLMATSTMVDWSATTCGSMPTGRLARISAIAVRMFLPSVRMSAWSRIEIARPMAGWPLTRNIGVGGSTKPRLTVAMSPRRMMRSPTTMLTFSMSRSLSKAPLTRR